MAQHRRIANNSIAPCIPTNMGCHTHSDRAVALRLLFASLQKIGILLRNDEYAKLIDNDTSNQIRKIMWDSGCK